MDNTTILILTGIVGIAVGFIIAKLLEKGKASKTTYNAKKEAESILKNAKSEGESIKKDKIFQAKEKFLELKYSYAYEYSKGFEYPIYSVYLALNSFIKNFY